MELDYGTHEVVCFRGVFIHFLWGPHVSFCGVGDGWDMFAFSENPDPCWWDSFDAVVDCLSHDMDEEGFVREFREYVEREESRQQS